MNTPLTRRLSIDLMRARSQRCRCHLARTLTHLSDLKDHP